MIGLVLLGALFLCLLILAALNYINRDNRDD